jgi:IS1 family transposase
MTSFGTCLSAQGHQIPTWLPFRWSEQPRRASQSPQRRTLLRWHLGSWGVRRVGPPEPPVSAQNAARRSPAKPLQSVGRSQNSYLTMPDRSSILIAMYQLSTERRAAIVRALVEGSSIRATCRMTAAAKNTVTKLLVELGDACTAYQDQVLRNLSCQRIQCDEIWSYVGAKQRQVWGGTQAYGNAWTWTAMDPDTKLIVCWHVGGRNIMDARPFIFDLKKRLANRVQITTDGHYSYQTAIEQAFGGDVDFAVLLKSYSATNAGPGRYSPPVCTGAEKVRQWGNPDPDHVSTSMVERQNLTMRMGMRRFTRLTNAFSKKIENHIAAVALHFMHYNFCRPHTTLTQAHPHHYPTTPAMAAGVADHVWSVEEVCGLLTLTAKAS